MHNNLDFICVIPARFASSRFRGKMLADLHGKPMIVRVAEQAMRSQASHVVVATDHPEIARACRQHHLHVVMTQDTHESGTDRIAEVVDTLLASRTIGPDTLVVNVQGDEPLIPVDFIDHLADFGLSTPGNMFTAVAPITNQDDLNNPNIVKCVITAQQQALYFSRAPIPYSRDQPGSVGPACYRHIGAYAYTVDFLKAWPELRKSVLEDIEKLEQLRALENGFTIGTLVVKDAPPHGVDTPEDLEAVKRLMDGTS